MLTVDETKKKEEEKRNIVTISKGDVDGPTQLLKSTSIETVEVKRSCKDGKSLTIGRSVKDADNKVGQPQAKLFGIFNTTKDVFSVRPLVKMKSVHINSVKESSFNKHPKVKVSQRPFEFNEYLSTLHRRMYAFLLNVVYLMIDSSAFGSEWDFDEAMDGIFIYDHNFAVKWGYVFGRKERIFTKLIVENIESILINALRDQVTNSNSGKSSLECVSYMNPDKNKEVAEMIPKDFSVCAPIEYV
uniref:ULP_PROTEASE domain-containing protein n=1 Tax=Rhabditophanes sp. KR3021 TaxID=114890 RepID=A0AC35UHH8_9BILA